MNEIVLIDCGSGIESPPIAAKNKAKAIYKLKRRYHRLCDRADSVRGNCMNLAWLEVSGAIFDCLTQLEELGIDVEKDPGLGEVYEGGD